MQYKLGHAALGIAVSGVRGRFWLVLIPRKDSSG
jgi:hypothetical protein